MKRLLDQNNSLGKLIGLLKDFDDNQEFEGLITKLSDVKSSLDVLNSENTTTHEEEFKKLVTKIESLRNDLVNDK
jgi:hypothetical protein